MSDIWDFLSKNLFGNRRKFFMAVVTVGMMLLIPLPAPLLDALMAINLVLALLILLVAINKRASVFFSIFPLILLALTVFNLALNVFSSKLILTQGSGFNGHMIRIFSFFMVGSGDTEGLVLGLVIFVVIITVQAVVIIKCTTHIAEAATGFALDALPEKQVAIKAGYSSRRITEEESIALENELQQELNFYRAMGGSSRFISGNVKVGILLIAANILGGIIIGTVIHGEPISQATGLYIPFAIGSGLLSLFPALLVSTATGIAVIQSVSSGAFREDVSARSSPAAQLIILAIRFAEKQAKDFSVPAKSVEAKSPKRAAEEMPPIIPLDPLSLELGYSLIPLVDREKGAELLERISRIRREIGLELGLVFSGMRVIDNIRLKSSEYCFKIQGMDVGRGKLRLGHCLCINPGGGKDELGGEKTLDPSFGLPALWVSEDKRDEAERLGYTVVDPPSIIATHLTEIIKRHAPEILDRQKTQSILDALEKDYPAVVVEAQKILTLGEIQKVLQALLREQVSIRNMVVILEALADYGQTAKTAKNMPFLIENVRQALGRQICLQYASDDRILRVLTLSQSLEQNILDSSLETFSGIVSAMDSPARAAWIMALSRSIKAVQDQAWHPVILCSEAARFLVKSSTEREIPELAVLSVPEMVSDIIVKAVGEVKIEEKKRRKNHET
ncbi:flagellar biosynthesis protein FlhA [Treponema primitia]